MDSQLYPAAIEVLQRDITDVDKHVRFLLELARAPIASAASGADRVLSFTRIAQLFPVRYQDHLLYHYLGGTILALMGDYSRAADLLETVRR